MADDTKPSEAPILQPTSTSINLGDKMEAGSRTIVTNPAPTAIPPTFTIIKRSLDKEPTNTGK